jgi:predicted nucleic acid-binding protein
MRIVFDTNVLVSAALKRKSMPGMAVHMVDQFRSIVSPEPFGSSIS